MLEVLSKEGCTKSFFGEARIGCQERKIARMELSDFFLQFLESPPVITCEIGVEEDF